MHAFAARCCAAWGCEFDCFAFFAVRSEKTWGGVCLLVGLLFKGCCLSLSCSFAADSQADAAKLEERRRTAQQTATYVCLFLFCFHILLIFSLCLSLCLFVFLRFLFRLFVFISFVFLPLFCLPSSYLSLVFVFLLFVSFWFVSTLLVSF